MKDYQQSRRWSDKRQLHGLCGRRSPRGVTSILYLNIYHIILYHFYGINVGIFIHGRI